MELQRRSFSTASAALGTGRPGETCGDIKPYAGPHTAMEIPSRLLMGPGPANPNPRVLQAQALPLLGHMHPPFFKILDDIQLGLQYIFQTDSKYTLLVSGSGHAGMEAVVANMLEAGETIVVGNHGIWGERVIDMSDRYGAKTVDLKAGLGKTLSLEQIEEALKTHKPAVLFLCQGDSSSGVHQSLAGVGDLCQKYGTLLAVDTVCSLGGVPFYADDWKVDAMYSGSQKVLGAPPGAAPLFFSQRAMDKLKSRKTKVASYYLDMNLVGSYWGWFGKDKRMYHHTALVSTCYGMREALQIVAEEGLEETWARHEKMHKQLWEGLTKLGLEPFVEDPKDRLVTVNTIKVPKGVDAVAIVKNAMDTYNVEIAGGLGASVGLVWRVGLLGFNANNANVAMVLESFRDGLEKQGKLGKL